MKSLTYFSFLFLWVNISLASPLINHVEDELTSVDEVGRAMSIAFKHRWAMIPDSKGRMHLTDLRSYVPKESFFVAESDMKFVLSTRKSKGEVIKLDVESLRASSFDRDHPTRITIHGWNGDHTSDVNARVIEEYLKHGDYNCIMVDWSRGAGTLDYIAARYRITSVAKYTAKLVDFLNENRLLRMKNLHIIGHSLGAHVAGLVGKIVSRGKVQAIYGLDPAGPLFYMDEPDQRIASTDGKYVEIMHTNGFTLGFGKPLGQADFFPNYGSSQPGCFLDFTGTCAHLRAPEYFAESINNPNFVAQRCESFDEIKKSRCTNQSPNETFVMHPGSENYELEGIFFLKTNSKPLFALGHQNISATQESRLRFNMTEEVVSLLT